MRSTAERYDERLELCRAADAIVDELTEIPPGPTLMSRLLALRETPMTGWTAVRVAGLWEKQKAFCEAEAMIPVACALDWRTSLPSNDHLSAIGDVGDEFAAETALSTTTGTNRVALVEQVNHRLPQAWEALHRGEWTLSHLNCLAGAVHNASAESSIAVDAVIVPAAVAQSWTPWQVKTEAAKALIAIDPEGAADRSKKAREGDDVEFFAGHDETATISASGPALTMRAMMDAIEALAQKLGEEGDPRPIGQRRITAMRMLILGEANPATGQGIEGIVTLDLNTYFGLSNGVAELSGYGPISAESARELLADANIRRMITDPLTGDLLDLGLSSYRPSAATLRFIMARDGKCTFPGCNRHARICDCDHIVNFPHGATDRDNLHMLCRRHHNRKTHGGWSVERHADGSETWTSAFGLTHRRARPAWIIEPVYPPDDGHLPDEASDELLDSDPDPPRPDDPLPDAPTVTLEDYYEFTDDLERAAIRGANKHYDDFYRSDHAA